LVKAVTQNTQHKGDPKIKTLAITLAGLMLVSATVAEAQSRSPRQRGAYYVGPNYRFHFGSPHHASTAAESQLRGRADLVRSWGMANLLNSHAMINLAAAQRMGLENQVVRTETFYQKRQIRQAYLDQTKEPRRAESSHAPVRQATTTVEKPERPKSITSPSGQVAWPAVLQTSVYARHRASVDQIVDSADNGGNISSGDRRKLEGTARQMLVVLRSHVRQLPSSEYMEARRFPEGLLEAATAQTG
jgi:hypothetical protein